MWRAPAGKIINLECPTLTEERLKLRWRDLHLLPSPPQIPHSSSCTGEPIICHKKGRHKVTHAFLNTFIKENVISKLCFKVCEYAISVLCESLRKICDRRMLTQHFCYRRNRCALASSVIKFGGIAQW